MVALVVKEISTYCLEWVCWTNSRCGRCTQLGRGHAIALLTLFAELNDGGGGVIPGQNTVDSARDIMDVIP